jgi:hypothetical protein
MRFRYRNCSIQFLLIFLVTDKPDHGLQNKPKREALLHYKLLMMVKSKKVKVFRYKPEVALGVPGG